jgi:serine/threonine protein kinase
LEGLEGSELGVLGSFGGRSCESVSGRGKGERGRAWDEGLKEKRVVTILWQLFQAVEYLHRNEIYHRELVTRNVMINPNNLKIR